MRRSNSAVRGAVVGGVLVLLAMLGAAVVSRSRPLVRAEAPPSTPALQLSEVMARAHLAFRERDGAWQGGQGTYQARVEQGGVALTAFQGTEAGSAIRLGASSVRRGERTLSAPSSVISAEPDGSLLLTRGEVREHLVNQAAGLEQSWSFATRPAGVGDLVVRVPVEGQLVGRSPAGLHFSSGALGFSYGHGTWVDAEGARTTVTARWDGSAVLLQVPAELLERSRYPAVLDPLVSPEISIDTPVYSPALNNQDTPSVAWNGSNYLAVWVDGRGPGGSNRDLYGTRVSAAGAVVDPAGILIATSPDSNADPVVASNGTDFLVAWSDVVGSNPATIFVSRVTGAGASLDPLGVQVATSSVDCQHPSLAWSGASYLLIWDETDAQNGSATDVVRGQRLDSSRALVGAAFNISPVVGFNYFPDLDWDGANYLVVWQQDNGAGLDIYGVRVSSVGSVGTPFAISTAVGNQYLPSVAWNGSTHLVVWHDGRTSNNYDVYGARVSAAGVTTDAAGILISAAAGTQDYPEVTAQGGNGFYVSWNDSRAGSDIYGAQVSNLAAVNPAGGGIVSAAANTQRDSAVASDGTSVLAIWSDGRTVPPGTTDVYGTLINSGGGVVTAAGTLISAAANAQATPAVAFDGTNYLVVWEDQRGAGSDVYGARVSKAGAMVDASAFVISNAANTQRAPAVAWTGANYFVAWQDDRTIATNFDIYGARVTSAGTVSDPLGIAINTSANSQTVPSVASDGTNALVVWQDERVLATTYDVYGARVSAAGALLDGTGVVVSAAANRQVAPSVAWNGATYLVAWEDLRASAWNIYAARVTSAMTVSDPSGFNIAAGVLSSSRGHASVAASGTGPGANFLVAWHDVETTPTATVDVFATRVTSAGAVSDSPALTISNNAGDQMAPAVASDGTNFQVVWQDHRAGALNWDLYGQRVVVATGARLDGQGLAISTATTDEKAAAIASGGPRSFLVPYQAFAVGSSANAQRIRARTLSNSPPVATAASPTTPEDTALPITLTGTDADGDALTFAVVASPTHGSLTGSPPSVTYTPNANYNGLDSFTFKTNDGVVDSTPGTISITVTAVNDLPVAQAQSVSTPEDTALVLVLTGTDVELSPLTFTVVGNPTHGSLTGTAPNLTYTPVGNYNGADLFTFKVNDGTADSASLATVSITVVPVNDPPVGTPQAVSTNEDTSLAIVLSGFDVEGSPLTYAIAAPPPHGTLTGSPPNLTYTPTANYNGPDLFTFTVNDGALSSAATSVSIVISPVNDAPVAQGQGVGTPQDTPLNLTLVGTDIDLTDVLTYAVVTPPTHGTVSGGTGAMRTYTPAAGYKGNDSFTFKVNDGTVDSAPATVNIAVASVNHAPVATAQSVSTAEDTAKAITLAGTDSDGDPLTFSVTAVPQHGTLTGAGSAQTYTPTPNYNGPDSFSFRVNDGFLDSPAVAVTLTITPVNDAPVAMPVNASTLEDQPVSILLLGTDLDGDPLTYVVTTPPNHGALSGSPPNVTYTPVANYNGADNFAFKVNDGTVDSAGAANVSIVIGAVNDAPVAQTQMVSTPQDTAKFIMLTAADVDGDFLVYSIVTSPTHGTLMGTPPSVTYVPVVGYRGNDTFAFKANDGQADSPPATIFIAVASVNHAPVVAPQTLSVAEDSMLTLTATGTDADGDAISWAVVNQPTHGTLTGAGPQYVYTPAANYHGPDGFDLKANDGQLDSAAARIAIDVTAVNDAPLATLQAVTASEDLSVSIVLAGSDVDGDPLAFTVVDPPSHGALTGNPPNLTYTPSLDYNGADAFTFKVNDGTVDSMPAAVTITVQPVNDAPVAEAISVNAAHDTAVAVTLRGTDVDGDGLTFVVGTQPENGSLSGSAPDLAYTPAPGFSGTDSFTYKVNDGTVDSASATVTVTVAAGGSGPTAKNYSQVNGWSCGCSQTSGSASVWAVIGVLVVWLRRQRRVVAALATASLLLVVTAAEARPTATTGARKAAKAAPAPAPVPPPAPEPAPPVAPPAHVEPAPAPTPSGPPSMAVLEVSVTVPNEKLDGAAFSEMLVTAVDQPMLFKVISSSEVATMLGAERQRQLLGCAEDSCLTEITDALGAQYLLQGSVGKVGENYLVTVRLIDAKRSRVIGRAAMQTADSSLLLNLVWRATQQAVDSAAGTLPADDGKRWLDRPRQEPAAAVAADRSRLGVAVSGVAGYQPLAVVGSRGSVGGEVDVTWRIGRFDLGAGIVISPSPGARLTVAFAVLPARNRLALAVRGAAFPVAGLYGGGLAVIDEFAITQIWGVGALVAGEVYGGGPKAVVALLGGLGVAAHF